MTTQRAPKKGEVWTRVDPLAGPTTFTCIDDEPDVLGQYGWRNVAGVKFYAATLRDWRPPMDPLLESWINVYPTQTGTTSYRTRDAADRYAVAGRIGILHLSPAGTVEFIDLRGGS